MAISMTALAASAMLQSTGLNGYIGASPNIVVYSGTAPANARAALSGNTVLATLPCAVAPFASFADNGSTAYVGTLAAVTPATAAATGTATFWRLLRSDGTVVLQGAVGISGSGAEMIMSTTSVSAGSTVSATSGTVSQPYG